MTHEDKALQFYAKATEWIKEKKPQRGVVHWQKEAAGLFGIEQEKPEE